MLCFHRHVCSCILLQSHVTSHPCPVVGVLSASSNCRLRALGLQPRTKAEAGDRRFPFVVFSAPPSGSEDYAAEVTPRVPTSWPPAAVAGHMLQRLLELATTLPHVAPGSRKSACRS